ncbi:hypothetical protein BU24DRAFT_411947 [Aaosphaeria arxii CBS 175.79]|uniref:Myb-like domain-containing protein n=1 Tax=Aaosphaeria arxii CBS 175.79 TaxID=1450172 RepID=A0A6A5XII8_9PLEO|nr:uncharacterized protein BU24DRAFT_411947 [Aaosphaeria arxii CBS 175.79]KAF2012600.1 hypothetical protein BU24DRAFT_411947 [Aaosphaeria arxii CBS 175.79]
MSSSRYPDNNRYPRDRSPYRDRRPSTYGSSYPPRQNEPINRSNTDPAAFPPRDVPRGPKSLVDAPRGPNPGPPSGVPSGPRDGRPRAFPGRGDGTPSLRDAPPLSTTTHGSRDHNTRDHWRADRDRDRDRDRERDRDRDFRDRRPSPPPLRRSPIRDSRDFPPRDLDIGRARRNSRDGPPSAGSTYSDPPLGSASSYRGSGIGRGRGGRDFGGDFRGRTRPYHPDDRDRHHDPRDPRDRLPERTYRPRSRSRDGLRRDRDTRDVRDIRDVRDARDPRDARDDRDFDRRDRDDRRFERRDDEPRRYDSYIGSASTVKPPTRAADSHRGSTTIDPRNVPSTPTGPSTPHSAHHPAPGDRLGPPADSFSRRSSVATEPSSAKDARRESDRNELLASRVEASRERYAPRASSPPAAVPAFGFSNVWRNPMLDSKSNTTAPKPPVTTTAPAAPTVTANATTSASVPASTSASAPAPVTPAPTAPPAPKPTIPSGLSTVPPTGPKADRVPERSNSDTQTSETKSAAPEPPRTDTTVPRQPSVAPPAAPAPATENTDSKPPGPPSNHANSPPLGPGGRNRPTPTGPQGAMRSNTSPLFPRPQQLPYTAPDAPASTIPSGPRAGLFNTSPKSTPINIPTGPKADRANPMAARAPLYAGPNQPPFSGPRMPLGVPAKSMQWLNPKLTRGPTVPSKREFPNDDRDRTFGAAPKAPKLEGNATASEFNRPDQPKTVPSPVKLPAEAEEVKESVPPTQTNQTTPTKPTSIEARRQSDVSMADVSPRTERPPLSAGSTAPKVLEDSDDDFDLDEEDFAESEAKYNREKALLVSRRIDLSASHLRATSPLQEIVLLSSLTLDHLPRQNSKPVEEEAVSPPPVQPPPEPVVNELLTPKAEESEDVVMEDKDEKPLAPATRALRLRREPSTEREPTPDLSSLPYLGSGPPTPLSDPDQERPSVPEPVLAAMRNNLQKEIVPELTPEGVLRQYAIAYRDWRHYIQELDDEREIEDPERQLSAEPGHKLGTPDVQIAPTVALLDAPPPTTSRRGASSRFASEFDFEQAIKESLKTAEEERMGKKDKEVGKSLADPEREAPIPTVLTAYEAQRRRFIDTNFQREPGQGVFVYHYEPPEDDFTEEEHKIMVQHYRDQYAKKWGRLAEILHKEAGTSRTYKDTINHYYATKWGREYKGKIRRGRGGPRKRGGAAARGRAANANAERSDATGEDGSAPLQLTDSGRPRRSAAPTFGMEADYDPASGSGNGRSRRQADSEGGQEKVSRRGRGEKGKAGRKPKNPQPPPAPAATAATLPTASPAKPERKERPLGLKMEEELNKRPLDDMGIPPPNLVIDQVSIPIEAPVQQPISGTPGPIDRARSTTVSRPGPSSYWSVTEQNDFQRYVAHFGTDWSAIANHMGTKTQTMVKNQYLRLVESGNNPELAPAAAAADNKRERGEDLGPPPTPTPAVKRRYESVIPTPRVLAPIPDPTSVVEAPKSPPAPKMSPPHTQTLVSRAFPAIAQAPAQPKPATQPAAIASMPESTLNALPSRVQQHSPPSQAPRAQAPKHQHSLSQHKPLSHGPQAGYFADDPPSRVDNRAAQQASTLIQPRTAQQPIQPQARPVEQPKAPKLRGPMHQEREMQPRLEPVQDRDNQARFQPDHTQRLPQEPPYSRFPPNAPSIRSGHAGSPEARPLHVQPPVHPTPAQSRTQPPPEIPTQPATSAASAVPHAIVSRASARTPPVKEEIRHYPMPTQPPQVPPPLLPQAQPQLYPHPTQAQQIQPTQPRPLPPNPTLAPAQAPAPPVAAKPAPPRKSNLFSVLNDPEPEEPRPRRPVDGPSHTPTPQQQNPIAPPPPPPASVTQAQPLRRELYNEPNPMQYPRQPYASQPPAPSQTPGPGRQIVDLTSEQAANRSLPRGEWSQRPAMFSGQGQPQPPANVNSPHMQPAYLTSHRSIFSSHNGPRHNPSPPPPVSGYSHSPHMHSRTPSLSGPPPPPSRHGLNSTPVQHAQSTQNASQILQPNPYAQVDPRGSGPPSSVPAGMRPSPLHTAEGAPPRDVQNLNEQHHGHNVNLPYSNPQTPNEHHVPAHLRGPNMDLYRQRDARDSRDPREMHQDFGSSNHERDVGKELAQRVGVILREQRDTLHSRTGLPQTAQDTRYQPTPPQERGYPTQRSHTPLSRAGDHVRHGSLQHPPHNMHPDNNPPAFGQRPPEDQQHRYHDPYAPQDRERMMREEQAHQARMRDNELFNREREMRDREMRDARYREDIMRRDGHSRMPPGPPPPGPDQRQGPPPSGPMDWTNAVPRHQEPWRR